MKWVKMVDTNFGIELELSCANGTPRTVVAESLRKHAGVPVTVVDSYARAHDHVEGWKLVHDGSIVCSRHYPNCSRFELVSPILNGRIGLNECNNVLKAMADISAISVNKFMGFHVHINVEGLSLQDLIKVCQNFVEYEMVMDSIMPPSRRTGSHECKKYYKSNKNALTGGNATNSRRHQTLAACRSKAQFCDVMNPNNDRCYKLNMQNLKTGRQPTIEFRQHSATSNKSKISSWVRFCMALVHNSARQPRPPALKESCSVNAQFEMLFEQVIKDRAIRDAFAKRRAEVRSESRGACCKSCGHGGVCAGK